jgi:hypothetical protein
VQFYERSYQEVLDDILTALVGGIVNEPKVYVKGQDTYPLDQPPVQGIRAIVGTVDADGQGSEEWYTFIGNVDYELENEQSVRWRPEGTVPLNGTPFYVDYYRRDAKPALTDINVGSVVRTLAEAIGREIATVYQQINLAYLSGFIDTAQAKSLDFVVAILGISRKTADYAVGTVAFFRDPTVAGAITVPLGTRLSTAEGVIFETTQERTLQPGFPRLDVPIRTAPGFEGELGQVDTQTINNMLQPIAGIGRVTNFDATAQGLADETDEELRARAKAALKGLAKCTVDALEQAVLAERADSVEIQGPDHPDLEKRTEPGRVRLVIEADAARHAAIEQAVWATKAAGINADTLISKQVTFRLTMSLVLEPGASLAAVETANVKLEVVRALGEQVTALPPGVPVDGAALMQTVKQLASVQQAAFKDVTVWRLNPAAPEEPIYDAGAVQGADGPATPEEIAVGDFYLVIGQDESIKLVMSSADVAIEGA